MSRFPAGDFNGTVFGRGFDMSLSPAAGGTMETIEGLGR